MSLVELLVGVAIGLFIVAAATLLVSNQLADNRRLLLETQLQQDMRAAMEIMTRQIRRVGLWQENSSLSMLPGSDGKPGSFRTDDGTDRYTINLANTNDQITFNYWLNPLDRGTWGFRLSDGRVMTSLSGGGWQELTDRTTLRVTTLRIEAAALESARVTCPRLCADGSTDCWPHMQVRNITLLMEAEAASDPSVRRRMSAVTRVRSHRPVYNAGSEIEPCPA
jgi:type II secretory pathway pseudopilin PulG